jgi:hypothetical protein
MKIRFRKKVGPWASSTGLYEWQPLNGNGRWYTIHRDNVPFVDGVCDFQRYVYNRALQRETVILRAAYFRGSYGKVLCVEGGDLN